MPSTEKYISGEQLKKSLHTRIDNMYKSKEQVITEEDLENGISATELISAVNAHIDKFADKK